MFANVAVKPGKIVYLVVPNDGLKCLRVGQGGAVELYVEDVAHQIAVLPDHLRDLRPGLIDQLLRPDHQLLQIVHRRPHRVDRVQRGLNHPIDYIEDRLNGLQYPQLRLCWLRRSHQRHNHDSGKRHRQSRRWFWTVTTNQVNAAKNAMYKRTCISFNLPKHSKP